MNAWLLEALQQVSVIEAQPCSRKISYESSRSIVQPVLPLLVFVAVALALFAGRAIAHDVSDVDRALIVGNLGLQPTLYLWLGAKHMVTGYDHLLFLVGVVFYLRRIREIAIFVTLFALGHSITLIGGVLLGLHVNPYLVDAIIGLSVAYKGFDNLGGFKNLFGETPDEHVAVFVFGLFHGLGLATKLQDLGLRPDGLVGNLVAFNVGVELGQFAALLVIVLLLRLFAWDHNNRYARVIVNGGLVVAGFALMTYQLAQYLSG